MKKAVFVPITKTGSSFIRAHLKYTCKLKDLMWPDHEPMCNNYHNIGLDTVVVIRDPLDRFLSSFYYLKNGSNIPGNDGYKKVLFESPHDLISSYINNEPTALQIFEDYDFEFYLHFKPQIHWLNGDPRKTHIIKYTSHNLGDRVSDAFRFLGYDVPKGLKDRRYNTTISKKKIYIRR